MANGMGNNFGKNIGNGISNAINKARTKANNQKQQRDVLNPEETNPVLKQNGKNALKNALKLLKNLAKLVAKVVKKLLSMGWVGIIILLIIIIAVNIIAFNNMPGMMKAKFKELFKVDTSGWFSNGAVDMLQKDGSDIANVLNYLESMEYNIIGDGFVTPRIIGEYDENYILTKQELKDRGYQYLKADDGKYYFYDKDGNKLEYYYIYYYDENGKIISNITGEPIENQDNTYTDKFGVIRIGEQSENSKGLIKGVSNPKDYRLVRTYMLSDYRIYNLKNADQDTLTTIFQSMAKVFGGNQDAWAKGLIKLYTAENGFADGHWWWGKKLIGDNAYFDGNELVLKKGFFNNEMRFSVDGWSSRYGMSTDFLLSLHLGTHAPDLVYAMLQNFDTEVQVYLDSSGPAKVNATYIDPNKNEGKTPETGLSLAKIQETLKGSKSWFDKLSGLVISEAPDFSIGSISLSNIQQAFNSFALSKKACQTLLTSDIGLESPDNCLRKGAKYFVSKMTGPIEADWLAEYGMPEENDNYAYEEIWKPSVFDGLEELGIEWSDGTLIKPKDIAISIDSDGESWKWDHTRLINEAKSLGFSGIFSEPSEKSSERSIDKYSNQRLFPVSWNSGGIIQRYWIEETVLNEEWEHEEKNAETNEVEVYGYEWKVYKYKIFQSQRDEPFVDFNVEPYYGWTDSWCWKNNGDDGHSPANLKEDFVNEFQNAFNNGWVKLKDTIICEVIVRDSNEVDDEEEEKGLCSNRDDLKRCCPVCQKYVKNVVKSLASVENSNYKYYTPYVARVVGSWFRDTYFVIPNEADKAIDEYAGEGESISRTIVDFLADIFKVEKNTENAAQLTYHPEFKKENTYGDNVSLVTVDEEYLGDSGEYWSKYEMKKDASGNETTEYQLYLLNADGSTSNIKMEQFLTDGKISATEKGKVNSNEITGYATQEEIDAGNWKKAKEKAEEDGWAFVKKAVVSKIDSLGQEGFNKSDSGLTSKLCWTAYSFDTKGSATEWEKVKSTDSNKYVNELYDMIYEEKCEENKEYGPDEDNSSGVFFQITKTNNVLQQEDAQRSETNSLVKYLFKYRQYYIYDGSEERAVQIEHDKKRILYGYDRYVDEDYPSGYYNTKELADKNYAQNITFGNENNDKNKADANFYHYKGLINSQIVIDNINGDYKNYGGLLVDLYGDNWNDEIKNLLMKYGRSAVRQSYSELDLFDVDKEDLANQWLDWQLDMYYMNKFGVNLKSYYKTNEDLLKLNYDPRDPDLIGTIEITKSSLSVFSILENTGSIDAEYAYRDLKELIVELDYFDKEDLSQKFQTVFTWVLPESNVYGWPNRPWDKQEVDYGALIQSCDTYDSLEEIEPSETGLDFIGYGDEELVVSPVTGKILEIGKHERLNVYSGEMEEVGYIIIQAMDSAYFTSGENGNYIKVLDNSYNYKSVNSTEDNTNYDFDNIAGALNLFYKEYEDVCAGYTVMIDGIDVDLQTTSESGKEGAYKENTTYGIYNSKELAKRKAQEKAKQNAPYLVTMGLPGELKSEYKYKESDGLSGYYVKEGKYIGKTMSNNSGGKYEISEEVKEYEKALEAQENETDDSKEKVEVTETTESKEETTTVDNQEINETNTLTENNDKTDENENKVDYSKFAGMKSKNYIRMLVKDTDYAVVDDVENFFKRDGLPPFDGISEEFLYWMLVHVEGGFGHLVKENNKDGYRLWAVTEDIGDGMISTVMGVTNACNNIISELGYSQYQITSVGQEIPLDVVRDTAITFIEQKISYIQSVFPGRQFDEYQMGALMSLTYNFGSIPDDIIKAIDSGNASEIKRVWKNYGSGQWKKYPGLAYRRNAEVVMYFEKKYVDIHSVQEIEFENDTPFTTYYENFEP